MTSPVMKNIRKCTTKILENAVEIKEVAYQSEVLVVSSPCTTWRLSFKD